jgi:lysophospholipase L1-like esterase
MRVQHGAGGRTLWRHVLGANRRGAWHPFAPLSSSSTGHQTARQTVNDWIRTSGRFDAVIDVEPVVRDPANPVNLLPAYDSGDHLHLNAAGYRAMADVIEVALLAN